MGQGLMSTDTDTDALIAELEENSKPTDPATGAILENANPDSDTGPQDKTDGRSNWSEERKRNHSAKLKEAWARRRANGTDKRGSGRKKTATALVKEISGQITKGASLIGGFWSLRDPYCGGVIIDKADDIGRVYGRALGNNERVARFFEGMSKGGQYGELILVTLTVALPILAHHDIVPRPIINRIMGALDPGFTPVPEHRASAHGNDPLATDPVSNPMDVANGSFRSLG